MSTYVACLKYNDGDNYVTINRLGSFFNEKIVVDVGECLKTHTSFLKEKIKMKIIGHALYGIKYVVILEFVDMRILDYLCWLDGDAKPERDGNIYTISGCNGSAKRLFHMPIGNDRDCLDSFQIGNNISFSSFQIKKDGSYETHPLYMMRFVG